MARSALTIQQPLLPHQLELPLIQGWMRGGWSWPQAKRQPWTPSLYAYIHAHPYQVNRVNRVNTVNRVIRALRDLGVIEVIKVIMVIRVIRVVRVYTG